MNINRIRGGFNVALQWIVGLFGRRTCRNCHWRNGCFKHAMHPPATLDCCCMWKAKANASVTGAGTASRARGVGQEVGK